MPKLSAQTILTSARISCYREIPDYYNTKNLAIGPWYLNDDDVAAYVNHPRTDQHGTFWGCANALEYGVCLATEDNQRATGWAIPCDMDGTHGDFIGALGAKDAADLMNFFNVRVYDALTRRSVLY